MGLATMLAVRIVATRGIERQTKRQKSLKSKEGTSEVGRTGGGIVTQKFWKPRGSIEKMAQVMFGKPVHVHVGHTEEHHFIWGDLRVLVLGWAAVALLPSGWALAVSAKPLRMVLERLGA
jgi:hypothetical protein